VVSVIQCLMASTIHGWGAAEYTIPALFDSCLHVHIPPLAEALGEEGTNLGKLLYSRRIAAWVSNEVSRKSTMPNVSAAWGPDEETKRQHCNSSNGTTYVLVQYQLNSRPPYPTHSF